MACPEQVPHPASSCREAAPLQSDASSCREAAPLQSRGVDAEWPIPCRDALWDLESCPLHPACRLAHRPWTDASERSIFSLLYAPFTNWVLEELGCEACGVRKPLSAFADAAVERALRRISRGVKDGEAMPRGQGGIRCIVCLLKATPPKNMVLEKVQAGRVRGKVTMTLELEATGSEERTTETGTWDLSSGQGMKSMEAALWHAGAFWVQQKVPGPGDGSFSEGDVELELCEAEQSGAQPAAAHPGAAEPTGCFHPPSAPASTMEWTEVLDADPVVHP